MFIELCSTIINIKYIDYIIALEGDGQFFIKICQSSIGYPQIWREKYGCHEEMMRRYYEIKNLLKVD